MANMNYTAIWETMQELQSIGNTAPTFFAPAVQVSPVHMPLQFEAVERLLSASEEEMGVFSPKHAELHE